MEKSFYSMKMQKIGDITGPISATDLGGCTRGARAANVFMQFLLMTS